MLKGQMNKWEAHIKYVRETLAYRYKLPQGWFYTADIDEYRRLVEDVPEGGYICELGCAWGRSLCSVSDIIKRKNLKVWAIDLFTGTPSEGSPVASYQDEFKNNLKRFGILDRVNVFKESTDTMAKEIQDHLFDLVFIDADHSYPCIRKDIQNWLPKLKEHGTISGHDYGTHEGIGRAVNEKWSNVRVAGYVWSKRL